MGGGFNFPVSISSFAIEGRKTQSNSPSAGNGSQLDSLSLPGDSCRIQISSDASAFRPVGIVESDAVELVGDDKAEGSRPTVPSESNAIADVAG